MINEIENEMECRICSMGIRSDAYAKTYCKVCGMSDTDNSIFVKRHNRKFHFCCEQCRSLFLRIGFNSFILNRANEKMI